MVAWMTRTLLLIQLAAALGIAFALQHTGLIRSVWLATMAGMGTVLLVRLLLNANNFLMAWRYRSETPPEFRLTPYQALRMFGEEFKSSMLTSSWYMPFFSFPGQHVDNSAALPVLLIHGYGCNNGYWYHLSRKLCAARITYRALNLEPVFGDIDAYVPALHAAVEALRRESGQERVILLAHSMGGLAARAYLCEHGAAHIAKIITLGVPHHGTGLAEIGIGKNSDQMRCTGDRPNSWLLQLAEKENPAYYALFVNIFSHHDNIVSPQTSSCLSAARNLAVGGIGHVALAFNPLTMAMVMEEIMATPTPSNRAT